MKKYTEARLEDAIQHQFVSNAIYQQGNSSEFDTNFAFEPAHVISFIQKTHLKIWARNIPSPIKEAF